MNLEIITESIELNDSLRETIKNKFEDKLDKYLKHFDENMKTAYMRIRKDVRWGFQVNFNLMLPGKKAIFAENKDKNLQTSIIGLRHELERQIKEYLYKINPNKFEKDNKMSKLINPEDEPILL